MIKRKLLLLVCIFTLPFMNGCINTLAQKKMESDLISLKEKVDDLEKNYESQLNKTIEDAVKEVDATYKNSMEVALKNQASISSDLESIRIDFRRVKGDVEEVAHKAEKYLTEDRGKIADYDLRLRDLELEVAKINGKLETLENNQKLFTTLFSSDARKPSATNVPSLTSIKKNGEEEGAITAEGAATASDTADTSVTADVTPPVPGEGVDTTAEGAAASVTVAVPSTNGDETDTAAIGEEEEKKVPEEAIKAYEEAYEIFKGERFDDAMEKFSEFVKKYPDTQLTDNAQYWIAECYYKKKEFDKAILEYDKMVADYPESDKVPSALLKEGFSFLQLNYKDEAIIKLKKLIADYPDTNQAEIARRKLKVIK